MFPCLQGFFRSANLHFSSCDEPWLGLGLDSAHSLTSTRRVRPDICILSVLHYNEYGRSLGRTFLLGLVTISRAIGIGMVFGRDLSPEGRGVYSEFILLLGYLTIEMHPSPMSFEVPNISSTTRSTSAIKSA